MPIENTIPPLHISGGEWAIPNSFGPQQEYTIARGESGSVFCPSSEVIADVDTSENWSKELVDRSSISIPQAGTGNGSLRFSADGWLAVCDGTRIISAYRVTEGSDVVVESAALNSRLDVGEFSIVNRENYSFSMSVDWVGDAVTWDNWVISHPSEISSHSQVFVTISVEESDTALWAAWLTVDDEQITLHFSARSTGASE
tara:strand:- start:215 stop:817 length:603 start_codon:yes stop_codon:yes gene_type:complete